jgi:acetoin utilization deacetylase AcuC-like enzyme
MVMARKTASTMSLRCCSSWRASCQGKCALALEGGYDPAVLGECVVGALRVLLGQPAEDAMIGAAETDEPNINSLLWQVKHHHRLFNPCGLDGYKQSACR